MLDREGIDKHRRRDTLPNAKGGSCSPQIRQMFPTLSWEKVACPPKTFSRKFH